MNTHMNTHNEDGRQPTKEYRLRGNRVHARLKILCLDWMKKNHVKVVTRLRKQAWGEEGKRT